MKNPQHIHNLSEKKNSLLFLFLLISHYPLRANTSMGMEYVLGQNFQWTFSNKPFWSCMLQYEFGLKKARL